MPLNDPDIHGTTFFGNPELDRDLPEVNEVFWASLIGHIEADRASHIGVILDIGCHSGGLLFELNRRFAPSAMYGIEPLATARADAAARLHGSAGAVHLLDPSDWAAVPTGEVDLVTSHEMLYLEPDVLSFMRRVRRVLTPLGAAYVVLGCHSENPLWQTWKVQLRAAGRHVYDHRPVDIMEAAASAGLMPAVQPLRCSGWIAYDPLRSVFKYPDVRMMFDHHYRFKLIFRLRVADDRTVTA